MAWFTSRFPDRPLSVPRDGSSLVTLGKAVPKVMTSDGAETITRMIDAVIVGSLVRCSGCGGRHGSRPQYGRCRQCDSRLAISCQAWRCKVCALVEIAYENAYDASVEVFLAEDVEQIALAEAAAIEVPVRASASSPDWPPDGPLLLR